MEWVWWWILLIKQTPLCKANKIIKIRIEIIMTLIDQDRMTIPMKEVIAKLLKGITKIIEWTITTIIITMVMMALIIATSVILIIKIIITLILTIIRVIL